MDTVEAWKKSPFGRCVAQAEAVKAQKREAVKARGALTAWQLADGFLVGDVETYRPTENEALVRLFYACAGWRLVARAWGEVAREAWERGNVVMAVALSELAREAEGVSRQLVLMPMERQETRKKIRRLTAQANPRGVAVFA